MNSKEKKLAKIIHDLRMLEMALNKIYLRRYNER
jgi:hypothetical protein